MQKAPKWTYVRTYFNGPYTPEEVDSMFHKELADWDAGDRYAIIFDSDMKAQVQYDHLKSNWFEADPIDALAGFFKSQLQDDGEGAE